MTALTFDLDPVDAVVVALLESPGNLIVHVGTVTDSDTDAKTISAPLPYVLYASSLPYQTNPRLGRTWRPEVTDFTVTTVHLSSDGCKAVAAAVRGLLTDRAVTIDDRAHSIHLADRDEPVVVAKDLTWSRPGGGALFSAVDRFRVV